MKRNSLTRRHNSEQRVVKKDRFKDRGPNTKSKFPKKIKFPNRQKGKRKKRKKNKQKNRRKTTT